MNRLTQAVVALAFATTLAGCKSNRLPMAPSDLTSGAVLYVHAIYSGESAHVTANIRDLRDREGPCRNGDPFGNEGDSNWNDCISSIRVAPGWRAVIYRDDDFNGPSYTLLGDEPNLQLVPGNCDHDGLNDCVTSIQVFRP